MPSVLLTPKAITKDNVKDVIADGYVTKDELCTGDFAALCTDGRHLADLPAAHAAGDTGAASRPRGRPGGAGVANAVTRSPMRRRPSVTATPLLELRGINKSFGPVQVLHDVGLQRLPRAR